MALEWLNSDVPAQQLALNLKELNSTASYPSHWVEILNLIPTHDKIIDLGCGVGAIFELLRKDNRKNAYLGVDFSPHMVSTASKQWVTGEFRVGDALNMQEIDRNAILLCNGLFDILPDGKAALAKILGYSSKHVIISRLTIAENHSTGEYIAYGTRFLKYVFSFNDFYDTVYSSGYTIVKSNGSSVLLLKN